MKRAFLFLVVACPVVLFAVDVPIVVPDADPFQLLLQLVTNFKAMGPLAIGAAIITLLVQVLKKFVGDFPYKRAVVASLGVVYGVVLAMLQGLGVLEALVTALFVSGGAVAIYEGLKPVMAKLKVG